MSFADCHQMSLHAWYFGQSSATPYRNGSAFAPAATTSADAARTAASSLFNKPSLVRADLIPAQPLPTPRPPGWAVRLIFRPRLGLPCDERHESVDECSGVEADRVICRQARLVLGRDNRTPCLSLLEVARIECDRYDLRRPRQQ